MQTARQHFRNQGNRTETPRFPSIRGSQVGTVNSVTYPCEKDELNTMRFAVTQVFLKIKYKQAQGCVYVTVSVQTLQAVKGLYLCTFSSALSSMQWQGGVEGTFIYPMSATFSAMNHLEE